eukprot:1500450-Lingulodinium_polyedra.AAC.1
MHCGTALAYGDALRFARREGWQAFASPARSTGRGGCEGGEWVLLSRGLPAWRPKAWRGMHGAGAGWSPAVIRVVGADLLLVA